MSLLFSQAGTGKSWVRCIYFGHAPCFTAFSFKWLHLHRRSTVVGLVSALLSGKAPVPGAKRSTSCVIHPGKTMGTSMQETNVRNRILVCATTNQAVDSLAWKIKNQSLGTSGKVGDFKMVRVRIVFAFSMALDSSFTLYQITETKGSLWQLAMGFGCTR